jgi:hypothetical protein
MSSACTTTDGKNTVADYFSCRWQLEIGIRQGQVEKALPWIVSTTSNSLNGEFAMDTSNAFKIRDLKIWAGHWEAYKGGTMVPWWSQNFRQ